jgi:predicted GH43/DUF377 family glycosyl hydrolase
LKNSGNPVLTPSNPQYNSYQAASPMVLYENDIYKMWYSGWFGTAKTNICYAESNDGISWTKYGIVLPYGSGWDGQSLLNPFVIRVGDSLRIY